MAASEFCHSCSAPLTMDYFKGPSEKYCKYCTDEKGKLLPKEHVQKGIAMWFKGWQGKVSEELLLKRAGEFMKGLPAWTSHK